MVTFLKKYCILHLGNEDEYPVIKENCYPTPMKHRNSNPKLFFLNYLI